MVTEDVVTRVRGYIQHQAKKGPATVAGIVAEPQARLLGILEPLDDSVTTRKPAPDEWCVRELLRHVIDAENSTATVIERLGHGTAISSGSPRTAGMIKEDNGAPYAQMLDELRAANKRLQDVLAALPADPNMNLTAPHPFFASSTASSGPPSRKSTTKTTSSTPTRSSPSSPTLSRYPPTTDDRRPTTDDRRPTTDVS
jgi:hypothetical protein